MTTPALLSVTLRPAREADGPWLYELYRATMRPIILRALGWNDREQRERFNVSYQVDLFELIFQGSTRVGALYRTQHPGNLHLSLILVESGYQNRKIGTGLIRDLQATCRAGGDGITLSVFQNNPAFHLYQRLGFSVDTHNDLFYKMSWTPLFNPPL
jgi:ribosomal protein S18 acetylase RimI-like enzyme